jgi:molybdopterin molybdotransferase
MITPDEALHLVVEAVCPLGARDVPLLEACGLQLAQSVEADRDYPPFDRAMMDGYAVRTADAGRRVLVTGEIPAGEYVRREVVEGSCQEIMTGAPCPPGTEAVVPKEDVRRSGDEAALPRHISHGQHIAPQGSECPAGQAVLRPGETVTPMAVAVMASFGIRSIRVTPRPSLGVITTGGELTQSGHDPAPGQIRDSNGPMLVAMAVDMALDEPPHLHAEDTTEAILDSLRKVGSRNIVLLTGGVSVGSYDLVPEAVAALGAEVVFHKVTQKPGKPLMVAKRDEQILFGLPGNPLAVHFCFNRYVAAAIRKMEGKPPAADAIRGRLAGPVEPKDSRTYFVTARAERTDDADTWQVHPMPGVTSADMFASAGANCYVEVPCGGRQLRPGETVTFTWIGNAPWPN